MGHGGLLGPTRAVPFLDSPGHGYRGLRHRIGGSAYMRAYEIQPGTDIDELREVERPSPAPGAGRGQGFASERCR